MADSTSGITRHALALLPTNMPISEMDRILNSDMLFVNLDP